MPGRSITSPLSLAQQTIAFDRRAHDEIPLLEARSGTAAARIAARLRGHSAISVYALLLVLGWALVAAITVAAGLVLVDVLVPVHTIGHDDEAVNTWLASHRTPTRNDLSYVGSSIGDVPVLPALVTLVVLVAAALRRWRIIAFVLGA